MNIVTRLIQHGNIYHAIVLDLEGKIHHEKFVEFERGQNYIDRYYRDNKKIVTYKV
jgi:hypothetical protein